MDKNKGHWSRVLELRRGRSNRRKKDRRIVPLRRPYIRRLTMQQLVERTLLAVDVFDVVSPAVTANLNGANSAILQTGAGSTLAPQISSSLSTASEQAFLLPALPDSQEILTGQGSLITSFETDTPSLDVPDAPDSFGDRLYKEFRDVVDPVFDDPENVAVLGYAFGCSALLAFTGVGLAGIGPACLVPAGKILVPQLLASSVDNLAQHAEDLGMSEATVTGLEYTAAGLDLGYEVYSLSDLAKDASNARTAMNDLAVGVNAIWTGLNEGADLMKDIEPALVDAFRDKGGAGQQELAIVAAEGLVKKEIVKAYAEVSYDIGATLTDEAKQRLRTMGLNDPGLLQAAGLPADVVNNLPNLLGTTPTASVSLYADGTLTLTGSETGDDAIQLREDFANETVEVVSNGTEIGEFSLGSVTSFRADLGGGNDTLSIGVTLDFPSYVIGGPGDDFLIGGPGDDTFFGEGGADRLYVGGGNDIAIGGDGDDEIILGNGDDIVFEGTGTNVVTDRDGQTQLTVLANSMEYQSIKVDETAKFVGDQVVLTLSHQGPVAPTLARVYRDDGDRVHNVGDSEIASVSSFVDGEATVTTTVNQTGAVHYHLVYEYADGSQSEAVTDNVVAKLQDTVGPYADIIDISPDPRSTPVASLDVVFSEAVFGVGLDDFELRRDGSIVPIDSETNLFTSNNRTYVISNLNSSTDGDYTLTLKSVGSNIVDAAGNPLTQDASDSWEKRSNSEGPFFFSLGRIGNKFSLFVQDNFNHNTFDFSDMTLFRNNQPVALDSSVTITVVGSGRFEIDLGDFITPDGLYRFIVSGEEVFDNDQNAGTGTPEITFVVGSIPTAVIDGQVTDQDGNALIGWTVYIDANDNRILDTGETSTTTDGQGNYTIGDLGEGEFIVRVEPPNGFTQLSPAPDNGELYMVEDGAGGHLYHIDVSTQTVTTVRSNRAWGMNLGLAASNQGNRLFGTAPNPITDLYTDGTSSNFTVGNQNYFGLAFDPANNAHYASNSSGVFRIDMSTGAVLDTIPAPPIFNLSGLTHANGKLYALGAVTWLVSYDFQTSDWTMHGLTELWDQNFGLAHDPFSDTFYVVAGDDPMLYTLDVDTAQVTPVFNTGITNGGGLAVVGHHPYGPAITTGIGTTHTVDFQFEQELSPTPGTVDLLSTSDTGRLTDDDLTYHNNADLNAQLQFSVDGVASGATVRLFADGQEIGSNIASGASVNIITNGSVTLADGIRSITATQEIPGVAPSSASNALMLTIDTVAPDKPSAPMLDALSDSGSQGDGITSDSTPTFSISALGTYRVTQNGLSISSDYESGASFTTPQIIDGTHLIALVSTDDAGNTSDSSDAASIVVDTSAPAKPIITGFSDDTGAAGDNVTADKTLTFTGTAEAGSVVSVAIDNTSIGSVVAGTDGVWTYAHESELSEATHSIIATSQDAAANVSTASDALLVTVISDSGDQPSIILGSITLLPNQPNQRVEVYGTNLDGVTGININAQLGDGLDLGLEPAFTSIDLTGSIFELFPSTQTGGPVPTAEQFYQGSIVYNNSSNQFTGDGLLFTLILDTTGFVAGSTFDLKLSDSQIQIDTTLIESGGVEVAPAIANGIVSLSAATVANQYLVYNDSKFDGNDVALNTLDDGAIATDKTALLPGETANISNVSSHVKGITAIFVDVHALNDVSANDFAFRVGNTQTPESWTEVVNPEEVLVRRGAGDGGSDRISVRFADNSIRGQWVQVTLQGNANTGLSADHTFYFGNAPGSAMNSMTDFTVNGTDMAGARDNQTNFLNPATIVNFFDYNRDGNVNGTDVVIARDNVTNFLTKLITLNLASSSSSSLADSSSFQFNAMPAAVPPDTEETPVQLQPVQDVETPLSIPGLLAESVSDVLGLEGLGDTMSLMADEDMGTPLNLIDSAHTGSAALESDPLAPSISSPFSWTQDDSEEEEGEMEVLSLIVLDQLNMG